MRLILAAVSKLKSGPERQLVDDYVSRARHTGRPLGFGDVNEVEVDVKAGWTTAKQTQSLVQSLDQQTPNGAKRIALDQRGKALTSDDFANLLAHWRDEGTPGAAIMIGGADGFDRRTLPQPDLTVSFGAMVWPHKLVRVMAAEQLYRALSILAGTPYHRA